MLAEDSRIEQDFRRLDEGKFAYDSV